MKLTAARIGDILERTDGRAASRGSCAFVNVFAGARSTDPGKNTRACDYQACGETPVMRIHDDDDPSLPDAGDD